MTLTVERISPEHKGMILPVLERMGVDAQQKWDEILEFNHYAKQPLYFLYWQGDALIGYTGCIIDDNDCGYLEASTPVESNNPYQLARIVRDATQYLFDGVGLNKVKAYIELGNTGAELVLRMAGFSKEGLFRRELKRNGQYHDALVLAKFPDSKTVSKKDIVKFLQKQKGLHSNG